MRGRSGVRGARPSHLRRLGRLGGLAALALAACGGPAPSSAPAAKPPARSVTVSIVNFTFQPFEAVVQVGDGVTWIDRDRADHTTTADPGAPMLWDSGVLHTGQSYRVVFDRPGTYRYHCDLHPFMHGEVRVAAP